MNYHPLRKDAIKDRVFFQWCAKYLNPILKEKGFNELSNFDPQKPFKDFETNGVNLCYLLETVGKQKFPRKYTWYDQAHLSSGRINHSIDNYKSAMKYLYDKTKLTSFNNVTDSRIQMQAKGDPIEYRAIVWACISSFHIKKITFGSEKELKALLSWCRENTKEFDGCQISEWKNWSSWIPFCALISHFKPDVLNFSDLDLANEDSVYEKLLEACQKLNLCFFLEKGDLPSPSDQKCLQTQVTEFFIFFDTIPDPDMVDWGEPSSTTQASTIEFNKISRDLIPIEKEYPKLEKLSIDNNNNNNNNIDNGKNIIQIRDQEIEYFQKFNEIKTTLNKTIKKYNLQPTQTINNQVTTIQNYHSTFITNLPSTILTYYQQFSEKQEEEINTIKTFLNEAKNTIQSYENAPNSENQRILEEQNLLKEKCKDNK